METLNFTKKNSYYESSPMSGGDSGVVLVHINFKTYPVEILVERTFDESMGWAPVATKTVSSNYEESITGVLGDTKVRIKTNIEVESAKYNSL